VVEWHRNLCPTRDERCGIGEIAAAWDSGGD
jgi:hypothetical protein